LQNDHPPVQAKMEQVGRVGREGQAVRLPSSNENTRWQNEPAVRRFLRRFRTRRERKIFNAARSTGQTGTKNWVKNYLGRPIRNRPVYQAVVEKDDVATV